MLLATLAVLTLRYDAFFWVDQQTSLKMKLGSPTLNRRLYDYQQERGLSGKIITQYWYLAVLPELGDNNEIVIYEDFGGGELIEAWRYRPLHGRGLRAEGASYLLLSDKLDPTTAREIEFGLRTGDYRQVFESDGFRLIRFGR
jgi:hypothetical protein